MEEHHYTEIGTSEVRDFMAYVRDPDPNGKWGFKFANGESRFTKKNSPATCYTYYSRISTFFNWLVKDGELEASPMERVQMPTHRKPQVQSFNDSHVKLCCARRIAVILRNAMSHYWRL